MKIVNDIVNHLLYLLHENGLYLNKRIALKNIALEVQILFLKRYDYITYPFLSFFFSSFKEFRKRGTYIYILYPSSYCAHVQFVITLQSSLSFHFIVFYSRTKPDCHEIAIFVSSFITNSFLNCFFYLVLFVNKCRLIFREKISKSSKSLTIDRNFEYLLKYHFSITNIIALQRFMEFIKECIKLIERRIKSNFLK